MSPSPSAEPVWPAELTARRLTCLGCHHFVEQNPRSGLTIYGDGRDPYFGVRLWFRTDCGEHILWVYNEAHLELLESYVEASVRERGQPLAGEKKSLIERLPS